MWTRGKDENNPGKFAYELWDGNKLIERVGNFNTAQEADRCAERVQRMYLNNPSTFIAASGDVPTDEELDELIKNL